MHKNYRGPGLGHAGPARYLRSKLTPAQRDEIRERHQGGESVKALALEYGVSTQTIRNYI